MKSKRTLIFFLCLFLAGVVSAQKIQQKKDSFEKARQLVSRVDGTLSYIEFNKSRTNTFADWSVFLVRTLELDHSVTFQLKGQEKDKLGYTHLKFSQEINGIPVEHSMVSLHLLEDQVKSISGFYKKVSSELQHAPNLSVSEILEMTQNHFDDYQILSELSDVELVYFPLRDDLKLAYRIKIESLNSIGLKHAYLSAENGALIASTDLICMDDSEGEAYTLYSGVRSIQTALLNNGHYNLYDQVRNVKTYDLNGEDDDPSNALLIEDEDNIWEEDEYDQHGALDAHWGASVSYDYYLSEHDYDSYDNQAAEILSYVNFETDQSIAFWNSEAMVFGSGAEGDSPYTSLDIVAHELTHAFTQHMVGFVNLNESGALSESFSDIFGVVIDYHVRGNEVANFLIGDECAITPVRNMANPNEFEGADTYQGDFWISDPLFNNGGIHFNCGVQNFWFYLLCEGGSGVNDNGDEYDVEAIGMDNVAQVCFRSLQAYLTAFSDFEDARTFSILAARELFGDCSDQVIAVTNAWYAVGVGDQFSFDVVADFSSSINEACALPVNVQFFNSSQNATTYHWDFGDGQTSEEAFPSHNYQEAGIYDVQLIANGEENCAGSDTLLIPDLINISNSENGPIAPACVPTSLVNPLSFGTDRVQFESIDIFSGDDSDAYSDFTCDATAFLNLEYTYTLTIDLFVPSKILVWIDFNNDGEFSWSELIYDELDNDLIVHEVNIVIPEAELIDIPLRMRVKNMSQGWDISPCFNETQGQMEDYTVMISEPIPQPPLSNFSVSNNAPLINEEVYFTDLSLHFPSSYEWSFPGGVPSSSIEVNPIVTYDSAGVFDVQLITSNLLGSDTLLIEDFIDVVDDYSNVESYLMCTDFSAANVSGRLYDSGGEFANYSPNENCGFLINPTCADSIQLVWEELDIQWGETIRIYSGYDDSASQVAVFGANNSPQDVIVPGKKAYISFESNHTLNGSGWSLIWSSFQSEGSFVDELPVSNFTQSTRTPVLDQEVDFASLSLNCPDSVQWLFPGGQPSNSTDINPAVSYDAFGGYDVTLITWNSNGSDTLFYENCIHMVDTFIMCTDESSTFPAGILYDSGGIQGGYSNNENCGFLIEVPCADRIDFEFQQRDLNTGDAVRIYEGIDNSGVLIHSFTAWNAPDIFSVYGGYAYIEFESDEDLTDEGWFLSWISNQEYYESAESFFYITSAQYLAGTPIQFQDSSYSSIIEWNWDFGDGTTSDEQNPNHIYPIPGDYTVSLEVQNCNETSISSQTVQILPSSSIELDFPDTIHVDLSCGATDTLQFSFSNPQSHPTTIWGNKDWISKQHAIIKALTVWDESLSDYLGILDSLDFPYTIEETEATLSSGLIEEMAEANLVLVDFGVAGYLVRQAVLNYISNGGTALVVGRDTPGGVLDGLDFSNISYPQNTEVFLTIHGEESLHNVMHQSIAIALYANNYGTISGNFNGVESQDPSLTPLVATESADGTVFPSWFQDRGYGHLIWSGSKFGVLNHYTENFALDLINFALDDLAGAHWLSFSEEGLINLPGNSNEQLLMIIESSDMSAGQYYETLEFNHIGDSGEPEQVVIELNLTDGAHVHLPEDNFNVSSTMTGSQSTDSLILSNSGCITLEGTISLESEAFNIVLETIELEPQEELWVPIEFAPPTVGLHQAEVIFSGNFETDSIILSGVGLNIPEFSTSFGDTLQVHVNCGGVVDTAFSIYNLGLGPLELSDQLGQGADRLKVLFIDDYPSSPPNLKEQLEAYFELSYEMDDFSVISNFFDQTPTDSLITIFNAYDLVICNSIFDDTQNATDSYVSPALSSYLHSGGIVLFTSRIRLAELAFMPITEYAQTYGFGSSPEFDLLQPNHPIASGMDMSLASDFFLAYPVPSNENLVSICERDGLSVVFDLSVESGRCIYLGFPFFLHYNPGDEIQLLRNSMNYLVAQLIPSWMTFDYSEDYTVNPSDSLMLPVSFDSQNLEAGEYFHTVQFNTNIPGEEVQSVVFHVVISGESQLEISTNSIEFGQVMLGNSYVQTLTIQNEGCDSLNLSVSSPSDPFDIQAFELNIPGYSGYDLEIVFEPSALGIYQDELTITNNGTLETISITGEANQNALADFTITPVDECQGTYQFICLNCLGNESLNWNFGDGSTSGEVETLYTFQASGDYTITLTVDNGIDSQTLTQTLSTPLRGIESVVMPEMPVQEQALEFQALSDVQTSYTWNFGDGVEILGGNEIVSHTYIEGGTYQVSVSLETDTEVCFDSQVSEIQIGFLGTDNQRNNFLVWPNPNRGTFSIEAQMAFEVERIINHLGQEVKYEIMKIGETSIEVKLENQSSGVYTIEINKFRYKSRVRVIVQ